MKQQKKKKEQEVETSKGTQVKRFIVQQTDGRPVIEMPKTPWEKKIDFCCLLFLVMQTVQVAFSWRSLPAKIDTAFALSGQAMNTSGKGTLLIILGLSWFLYIFLSFFSRHPYGFNYPIEVTKKNAKKLYTLGSMMMAWVKLLLIVLFTNTVLSSVALGLGNNPGPSVYITYGVSAGTLIVLVYYLMQMRKLKDEPADKK